MNDLISLLLVLLALAVSVCALALPIAAFVLSLNTRKKLNDHEQLVRQVKQLSARVEQLERGFTNAPTTASTPLGPPPPPEPAREPLPPPPPVQSQSTISFRAANLESVIGRRWIGWIAILLILFATGFFLKYAFDNRWIGEVGRVAIGIAGGAFMTLLGFRYFRRGWKLFSQILTSGGVVLLYLSTYAAFGYYQLIPQAAAFAFLVLLIAEAAALALLYEAPAIAIMALVGGFLTPLLLHSDQDQHRALFSYIIALDLGALALLKHWRGLRTIAFLGSHFLFWVWYVEHFRHERLLSVWLFQFALFVIFLAAHLIARLLRRIDSVTTEDIWLLVLNPFVFFVTTYQLLNYVYPKWMGVFAIAMALLYAATAKMLWDRVGRKHHETLALLGVSVTFVTIAIPIQLRANWITIAWAVEALMMVWAGTQTRLSRFRVGAGLLFTLTLIRLLIFDTPYGNRGDFIPIFNRYFLSSLLVIGCVFAAAMIYQRSDQQRRRFKVVLLLAAVVSFWLVCSLETNTYFKARALAEQVAENARHQRWLGQMALTVVWSLYAAVLAAIGFIKRSSAIRWVSLLLFAWTIVKAVLVDMAELQQLYRIIVFFVLGVLLLLVAWAYHRGAVGRRQEQQ
ncbi:MAG TPA: DUF2339 domain-containing protein [Pyrinomonadaceae bacterium]